MADTITPEPSASPVPEALPRPRFIAQVALRIDEKLSGYRMRLFDRPIPGPGIKQVYRQEPCPAWPIEMDEKGVALANALADDLAEQLIRYADRAVGKELVSWAGDIPHTVDAGDRAEGQFGSVRVIRTKDRWRFVMRLDVGFRMRTPQPKPTRK